MAILERAAELDHLRAWLQDAREGNGRVVLVGGELGIGKTTLVDEFARQLAASVTVATIPFDGISIPDPLGPLLDLARILGHDVDDLTTGQSPRPRVFRAIESSLRNADVLTLLVAEDAHWADEASLEFLRFLSRRIGTLRAMAIVTYRDDELSPGHPLRQVIGDLATERAIRRISLSPLSIEAVRTLAAGTTINPIALHAHTGGNAFFVTEVISSGLDTPLPVTDAVLGRAARLGLDARETLEAAAAIGARVDPHLLSGVVGRPVEREIAAAFNAGLLRADGDSIAFRHAAVRAVVLGETSPVRARSLHERILTYLQRHPETTVTPARLAFHAEQAGNRLAAHRYALAAADEATRLQSHREAADQYARALRCAGELAPDERARVLEGHAFACFLTSRMGDAIASQEAAAAIWWTTGDQRNYGHNLRRLSRYRHFDGHYLRAAVLAEESVTVLQAFPDSSEYAMACGYLAEWRIRAERLAEARDLADRSKTIAQRLHDRETTIHALITRGMVQLAAADPDGAATLDAGLAMAQEIGHEEFELRALTHLCEAYGSHRFRPESRAYAEAGLELARTRELSTMIALFGSVRLAMLLDACDWPAAIAESATLIANGGVAGRLLLIAHLVWAKARLRSGLGAAADLEPARSYAGMLDDPVARAMVTAASLEAAWLAGPVTEGPDTLREALEAVRAAGEMRAASDLALWMFRAGSLPDAPAWVVEPYASEIRGHGDTSATLWDAAGVPLEAVRARSASLHEADLRAAHAGFVALGAVPDALRVTRRMQALGIRGIPRGPRPSTRQNAALLSRREIEVLLHLANGATNREIAEQLSVSPKTVDHHISSILGKLGAPNRQQAVVRARDDGLLPK